MGEFERHIEYIPSNHTPSPPPPSFSLPNFPAHHCGHAGDGCALPPSPTPFLTY
jgi:hypothetical protein